MDIELITLVNSFRNTIALNNLLIKEKILRKLEMIHTMRMYGFPLMNFPEFKCNSIIQELRRIDKEGDIVKYSHATNNSDTNKILGDILHNAYQASGYDIILSNAPTHGTTISGDFIQLDCEAIYDTLVQYTSSDAVVLVHQIAADTYLIKMDSKANARALCELLNEKQMANKIIKVEYIAPLVDLNEEFISELDAIDGIECDVKCKSEEYKVISVNNNGEKQSYLMWMLNIISRCLQRLKLFRWK